MTLLVLRGFAALQALSHSASTLLTDATTIVRHTKSDSKERIHGTGPTTSPQTGRPTRCGMRGIHALAYAVARWPEWQTGLLGVIDRESMRRTVKEAVEPVLAAGDALINACCRAERVHDKRLTAAEHRLIDGVNMLNSVRRHVPGDPEPTPGKVLVALVRQLVQHNSGLRDAVAHGPLAGHGLNDEMTTGYVDQTWKDELNANSGHGRYWLDAVLPEDEKHIPPDDQVMATLYELSIAVIMLGSGPRTGPVTAAHEAILEQPYWRLVKRAEWLEAGGKPEHNVFNFPWMPIENPVSVERLDALLAACEEYAAPRIMPAASPLMDVILRNNASDTTTQTGDATTLMLQVPKNTECVFRRCGSTWEVKYGGAAGVFSDLVGMKYISALLARPNPNTPVPAIDLVGIDPRRVPQTQLSDTAVDQKAKARYQDEIARLDREMAEAQESKDEPKQALLENERSQIIQQLAADTGLGGRIRALSAHPASESARSSVKAALARAYRQLRQGEPSLAKLAEHLNASIKTRGAAYAYEPPGPARNWVLE